MKATSVIAVLVTSLFTTPLFAGSSCDAASSDFGKAAAVYLKGGRVALVDYLLATGPLSRQAGNAEGARNLQQLEDVHGPLQGLTLLSAKGLGKRTCYVVSVLEYANGPAFMTVMYYGSKDAAVPITLRFDAEPERIYSIPALIND